jgi:hypothetical protein
MVYGALGFTLNLENGTLTDNLNSNVTKNPSDRHIQLLITLLSNYALANPVPLNTR